METKREDAWNFFEMFQEIQNRDLCKGNPWLDKNALNLIKLKISKRSKHVSFKLTEITPTQLPHCRRNDTSVEFGCLHSKTCKNSYSEKSKGCDDLRWRKRAIYLQNHGPSISSI